MQFLVRKTHHTTGEVFFDVTRAKENEEFIVVDAENKEDAKEKVEYAQPTRCPKCNSKDIEYEYGYADDEPDFCRLLCNNCDEIYIKYIRKDSDQ
ncbi:DUF1381 domain-containing protein [Staphylococcus cohnii]|uniref:DUF1381 domain-containing protein n=1 Tax=Staphylococcus cohnii TaxID=29382 RepID=UPI00254F9901|nr:DUF1381 domain-containing protein [Staphylococcus cohnii]WIL68775.1 DUF1381 domain-containing protein [Staphylococcus cohnii]